MRCTCRAPLRCRSKPSLPPERRRRQPTVPRWVVIAITGVLVLLIGTVVAIPTLRSHGRTNQVAEPAAAPEGMVWIPGGDFTMGSPDPRGGICGGHEGMPDARPLHRVHVD